MSSKTGIEWTEATWNPVRGCSRISEGCRNCYAELVAARFSGPGLPYEGLARMTPSGPRWTGDLQLIDKHLEDPIRWQRPRKIFVNSMSDLFHEKMPFDWIQAIFDVMFSAKRHTYQILTKRADVMAQKLRFVRTPLGTKWEDCPDRNIWIGISVENQEAADTRLPYLRETPAAVRFLSVEPLIEKVDLRKWLRPVTLNRGPMPGVDWVIVGAESGGGARPMELDWARDVRDQCAEAGVPFFLKQGNMLTQPVEVPELAGRVVDLPVLDGRTWAQFPKTEAA